MNMAIVKQYLKNAFRVVAVLTIAALSMIIGDKFQPVTYLGLTADYLHQTEVKKTVVHKTSPVKVADKVTKKGETQTSQKDVLWEHVGKLKGEYVVKDGDTLWNIARKHDVSPKKLLLANNMTRDTKLRPGQLITIPN
ncbi:MAG: LysM peptidoglycan-binding domain-containing protein [Candidatus Yonathbacteria bacterium]|nr:LysM peptidoglycan-binding domain-containing protein [Candidatus Yonathbacteria bacterium]